ncbi:MAG: choline kinase family protein [Pseudomonadota bacterium]
MANELEVARQALAQIPALSAHNPESAKVQRLGGLTNLVYRVEMDDARYCLRIPGKGTEEYIDREVEAHNAKVAATAGVSPAVVHVDPASGVLVTEYLDGCLTMTPESFARRPGAPARAADAFRKLHGSGLIFQFRFELFDMIDDYLTVLAKLGAQLPEGYHDVVGDAEAVRAALNAHPAALAPCHCDPLCENFLDDGTNMWIVDWEYSGMNDPLWDLGDLSVEASFTDEQDREMMAAYFEGAYSEAQFGRMVIYKAMCDLLWTLWGLIQHANDNPAEDFWDYATTRFERCKSLMGHPDFAGHVAAVKAAA